MTNKTRPQNVGDDLIEGLTNALTFANGDTQNATVHIPEDVDVRAIRQHLRMSQERFAGFYGFALRTLQEWEQGRRCPDRTARAYLHVISKVPKAVAQALQE